MTRMSIGGPEWRKWCAQYEVLPERLRLRRERRRRRDTQPPNEDI